jgi:hypothetical protein
MTQIITEDSKLSSIRASLITSTISVCLLMLSMGFHIVWHTVNNQSENIEWQGMSIFLAGISAVLGTVLYNKVKQKNIELTNSM